MRKTILLGAALILASPLVVSQALSAGTALPQATAGQTTASEGSIVHKASRRCRRWRNKCAYRWGWRTGRFYRCLRRHYC